MFTRPDLSWVRDQFPSRRHFFVVWLAWCALVIAARWAWGCPRLFTDSLEVHGRVQSLRESTGSLRVHRLAFPLWPVHLRDVNLEGVALPHEILRVAASEGSAPGKAAAGCTCNFKSDSYHILLNKAEMTWTTFTHESVHLAWGDCCRDHVKTGLSRSLDTMLKQFDAVIVDVVVDSEVIVRCLFWPIIVFRRRLWNWLWVLPVPPDYRLIR